MTTRYKLVSWNVNGVRAVVKKGFWDWLYQENPDVLGLQETKIDAEKLAQELTHPKDYDTYWNHCQRKKGYSGVCLLSKRKPLKVREGLGMPDFDNEGRVIVAEYPEFDFYNIYFPNGQMNEERLAYKLAFYDAFLEVFNRERDKGKKLVVTGDFNTAHKAIDLARPKENEKTSGFLPIERAWMDKFIGEGYIDTFREFDEGPNNYTWWNMRSGARARNVGWRIDYFFVSPNLRPNLVGADIRPDVQGSDHCPIILELEF